MTIKHTHHATVTIGRHTNQERQERVRLHVEVAPPSDCCDGSIALDGFEIRYDSIITGPGVPRHTVTTWRKPWIAANAFVAGPDGDDSPVADAVDDYLDDYEHDIIAEAVAAAAKPAVLKWVD